MKQYPETSQEGVHIHFNNSSDIAASEYYDQGNADET